MRITELAKRTGASTDQIRYLERKRFINPSWVHLNRRRVRDYTDNDAYKAETIIKYLEQGFRYDVAYQKAMEELQSSRLI